MNWWQQFVFAFFYALFKAYFDAEKESKRAVEESPSAIDRARADDFKSAIVRAGQSGDSAPVDPSPHQRFG